MIVQICTYHTDKMMFFLQYLIHCLYLNRFLNNITEIMSTKKRAEKGDFIFVIPHSSKK